jgi:hypothetical protein
VKLVKAPRTWGTGGGAPILVKIAIAPCPAKVPSVIAVIISIMEESGFNDLGNDPLVNPAPENIPLDDDRLLGDLLTVR